MNRDRKDTMPAFHTEVPNPLSQEDAIARLKDFMVNIAGKYKDQIKDMSSTWTDNRLDFSFTSLGFRIAGVMTVEEDKVTVGGDLPFAAAMFRGKIENDIAKELKNALG